MLCTPGKSNTFKDEKLKKENIKTSKKTPKNRFLWRKRTFFCRTPLQDRWSYGKHVGCNSTGAHVLQRRYNEYICRLLWRVKTQRVHGIGQEMAAKCVRKLCAIGTDVVVVRVPGESVFGRLRDGAYDATNITCGARSLAYGNSSRKEKKGRHVFLLGLPHTKLLKRN